MLYTLEIKTNERFEIVDITDEVQKAVWRAKLRHGIVVVFSKHTTTGLLINENESGLIDDLKSKMKELIPKGAGYKHDRIDSNAHSHIRASLLLNPELVVPVDQGELQLGTWQRILFVELDGPRYRKLLVMACPCPEFPEE